MARFSALILVLLTGCVGTRTVVEYVPQPVEVRVPVPVQVCQDEEFRNDFVQAYLIHRDFRTLLSPHPQQHEVISATLRELQWRADMLRIVAEHYRNNQPE